jgi:hypothetical protein
MNLNKQDRPANKRLPDIKVVRGLTRLLGKLHLPCCFTRYQRTTSHYDESGALLSTYIVTEEGYGYGLKESKDFVERWFNYVNPPSLADSYPWMPYPRD